MIRMCTARPFRAVDFYSIILFDCLSSLSFLFFHEKFPNVLQTAPGGVRTIIRTIDFLHILHDVPVLFM
ncbi:MAG: hypothetical protein K2N98_09440, partial [Lachnospiraceae bacterium]|nr:hypothetical protein [Lachnospiraceae bacterium]